MMEESIFKSCLKRKVKFTVSTFVKFLITGTVALSLTACGGGGGSSSWKAPTQTDNIENAQTDVKAGINLHIKNISVNAELGKEFGKRDREYVKAGFKYTF